MDIEKGRLIEKALQSDSGLADLLRHGIQTEMENQYGRFDICEFHGFIPGPDWKPSLSRRLWERWHRLTDFFTQPIRLHLGDCSENCGHEDAY